MKVTPQVPVKDNKQVQLEDIEIGEFFIYNSCLYLKEDSDLVFNFSAGEQGGWDELPFYTIVERAIVTEIKWRLKENYDE